MIETVLGSELTGPLRDVEAFHTRLYQMRGPAEAMLLFILGELWGLRVSEGVLNQ